MLEIEIIEVEIIKRQPQQIPASVDLGKATATPVESSRSSRGGFAAPRPRTAGRHEVPPAAECVSWAAEERGGQKLPPGWERRTMCLSIRLNAAHTPTHTRSHADTEGSQR